jgi:hypothetical protein
MMKALKITLTLLFFACALPLFGQNPLVGTWERQTDSIWAMKIITPTHWIIFIEALHGDSNKFIRSHGGTYTLKDNKYIEYLDITSWDNKSDLSFTDYTYKVAGDKFYQHGTLILSDGTVTPIDEVWQKVSTAKPNPDFPAIGSWNLLSSSYTGEDGKKETLTNVTANRFEIITPTHWMRISHRDHAFESAMGGTYTSADNKASLKVAFATFPINTIEKIEVTDKVTRDKRSSTGIITGPAGKTITAFEDVYKKATGKPQSANK